jgi:hypothetical protein
VIAFADGHGDLISATKLLTSSGAIIWDANSAASNSLGIIWTPDPKEDPNN